MSKFLKSSELREWIPRIITEAQKELVIIVPYIKTSKVLYESLFSADKKGVESIIVYRENALPPTEQKKLKALDNLNLLYHPNVHAKCYMNEKYLIISSMNLYEFSIQNNREMGVIFFEYNTEAPQYQEHYDLDEQSIEDAREEINAIITAANLEKASIKTNKDGFALEIINSPYAAKVLN